MENSRKNVMQSQARELISTVYQRMKYEAENGVERLTDARWRTSKAVGVSERTITRILKEKAKCDAIGTQMSSPHQNKNPRIRLKRDIDEFDKEVIRSTVSNFHKEYKQYPTLKALKEMLTEKIQFDGCLETLRRILLDLGVNNKQKNASLKYNLYPQQNKLVMENSRKKVMQSQAREVISTVYRHMKHEAETGVERLTDAIWRTSRAVGVSEMTVSRILKEKAQCDATVAHMSAPHQHQSAM